MIFIENLTVNYPGKKVIKKLNLSIPQGKITALIGPNGCGKSTLLKAISGGLKISDGKIRISNLDLSKLNHKVRAQHLSILPQSPITPEGVTVQQLVSFGRNPYLSQWGTLSSDDKNKVSTVLRETNLIELAQRPVNELSGGQRQRVWIAMILAQDTEYILLDEPTTYLDLTHQVDLMKMIQGMNKQGKTIIVVLHDLNQASRYCDELIVMKNGEVHAQNSPEKIFNSNLLKSVFDLNAVTINDPIANKPMCIPI